MKRPRTCSFILFEWEFSTSWGMPSTPQSFASLWMGKMTQVKEAETPVLWPPHAKSWLIGKDSDAGRDWGQEEKGTTEDEIAGCYHWLDGRESEWTPGVCDGQGGLACCDSWGWKELDTTDRLNLSELKVFVLTFFLDTVLKKLSCPALILWKE